jgi:uncharacterized protein YndB with AHSA1/START domain
MGEPAVGKLTVERSIWIAAPRERVWRAVTEETDQWFSISTPATLSSRSPGGRISVTMQGVQIEVAVIEVYDPPHEFTTRELPGGLVTVSFLLDEENGGTRVTVIERGLEALPEQERQARLTRNAAAWTRALDNLSALISGAPLPHPEGF